MIAHSNAIDPVELASMVVHHPGKHGGTPSALKGRAAIARGEAPGLRKSWTVVSPNGARWAFWRRGGQRAPLGLYDLWREFAYQGRCPWLLQRRTFGAISIAGRPRRPGRPIARTFACSLRGIGIHSSPCGPE